MIGRVWIDVSELDFEGYQKKKIPGVVAGDLFISIEDIIPRPTDSRT